MSAKFVVILLAAAVWAICAPAAAQIAERKSDPSPAEIIVVDPTQDTVVWEGWGSSLAWWARAIGGTRSADEYADLLYTTKSTEGYPGLGLNVVRYNLGGGGVNQPRENKGPKLQWQMDMHGYWVDPDGGNSNLGKWDWSNDSNQRALLQKAHERGANIFELFSDTPPWWMNYNHSTAGSDSGGNCLMPKYYDRFATYLATVAQYSAEHWGIRFGSVEAFNEPSAGWWKYPARQEGCHFEVTTQEIIAKRLRKALDHLRLKDVAVAAADENDVDVALTTWNAYDQATRDAIGKLNVHGYYKGGYPYRGENRSVLRSAVRGKRLWISEYGDGDASGLTMADSIVKDIHGLHPTAWVYWQPVEPDVPEYGWGLANANYIDTQDRENTDVATPLVRVNRKFFVYGQFTRYIRPGYHILRVDDENSIAAYNPTTKKVVIVTVNRGEKRTIAYDLSGFSSVGDEVQQITTTTDSVEGVPDWKQHASSLQIDHASHKIFRCTLYPNSVYTFVIDEAKR